MMPHPVNVSAAAAAASVRCNKVVTALSDQIRTALKIPLSIKISALPASTTDPPRETILKGDTQGAFLVL